MLATLLMANSVDYQEVRVAIVLYAIAQVLRQSAALIKAITKFARVVKRGKTTIAKSKKSRPKNKMCH